MYKHKYQNLFGISKELKILLYNLKAERLATISTLKTIPKDKSFNCVINTDLPNFLERVTIWMFCLSSSLFLFLLSSYLPLF